MVYSQNAADAIFRAGIERGWDFYLIKDPRNFRACWKAGDLEERKSYRIVPRGQSPCYNYHPIISIDGARDKEIISTIGLGHRAVGIYNFNGARFLSYNGLVGRLKTFSSAFPQSVKT